MKPEHTAQHRFGHIHRGSVMSARSSRVFVTLLLTALLIITSASVFADGTGRLRSSNGTLPLLPTLHIPPALTPSPTPPIVPTEGGTGGGASSGAVRLPRALNLMQEPSIAMQPARLDDTASAIYGDVGLTPPDSVDVSVTGGGSVAISYLGDCFNYSGFFASPAPTLRVHYLGRDIPPFYSLGISGFDPTGSFAWVVREPGGEFVCGGGTFYFDGTYDVWVASRDANTSVSLSLRISTSVIG